DDSDGTRDRGRRQGAVDSRLADEEIGLKGSHRVPTALGRETPDGRGWAARGMSRLWRPEEDRRQATGPRRSWITGGARPRMGIMERLAHPVLIGCCGWSYPDWEGPFYPPGMASGDYLEYYADR